ncbi:MAG: FkbM family methyltransferase [Bacteroidales bacterium]|nr:FkbM family methyltransferase [Bacteroidales bacterium]MBN2698369.1 FkbM family methyltransferase [Bacteroidales bacterium]
MKLLAYMFKLVFRLRPLRKYYFGLYKKLFRPCKLFRGVKTITPYDRNFRVEAKLDDWIQQQIFFFGIYDQAGIRFLKKNLKPDDTFIDAGANIGIYSLSASAILKKETGGRIYAFEPVGELFAQLQKNILLNGADGITPVKAALYNENTKIDLYRSGRENLGMSSILHHDHESGTIETVEAVRLDDFIEQNRIKRVNLLKLDIEGAELYALKGMSGCLRTFRPVLLVEINDNILEGKSVSTSETFTFLTCLGYAPYVLQTSGDVLPFNELSSARETNFVFIPTLSE